MTAAALDLTSLDLLIRNTPDDHKPALLTAIMAKAAHLASMLVRPVEPPSPGRVDEDRLLRVPVVAEILGVDPQTVYRMIWRGALRATKHPVRVRESVLKEYIAKQERLSE